jgi:N12 class adenine-specific DNA methylase
MQLDMFGATEDTATLDAAPPVLASSGAWCPPEALAFNNALAAGSLADAIAIINRLKGPVLGKVLLAAGFSVGASENRDALIARLQPAIVAAARLRVTGFDLQRDGLLGGNEPTQVVPAGVRVGDILRRGGESYVAVRLEASGMVMAEAREDIGGGVIETRLVSFNEVAALAAKMAAELHVQMLHEQSGINVMRYDALINNPAMAVEGVNRVGTNGESREVRASAGAENRGDGVGGDVDSEPLDVGLAPAGGSTVDGRQLPGAVGGAAGAGVGGVVERAEFGPPGTPRDIGRPRDFGGAAIDSGVVERGVAPQPSPAVDYVLTEDDRIGLGGLAEKFDDNLRAILVLRVIATEQRHAVGDELRSLARYVGWGGLKGVFDPDNKKWQRQHVALRSALTDAEWSAASRSQLDSFYTPPVVGKAMYSAIERLGFVSGRVLEPSVGVGNFFGLMPESMRQNSQLHGVELDILTSQIVAALYPSAKIAKATGFQSYNVPAGYFDLAIGNPPFGNQMVSDEKGSAYSGWSIHNYFFAKSIDLLRPGGIMPMVVSHSFLDKLDPHVRQWIARRAELVSGVRLPNTAFKENANTEVVTDVLIFRRLDYEHTLGAQELPDWLHTSDVLIENPKTGESEAIAVNDYFIKNPQNVLGTQSAASSAFRANEYTVLPNGELAAQLAGWIDTLPTGIYSALERSPQDAELKAAAVPVPEFVKEGSFFSVGTAVWQRLQDSGGSEQTAPWVAPNLRATERMLGMIEIREVLRSQMRLERSVLTDGASEIEAGRRELNRVYDGFKKKHGFINDPMNRRVFLDDTESALIQALEFDYEKAITPLKAEEFGIEPRPAKAVKADIFSRRVLFPPGEIEVVETAKDALLHSLNYRGQVDMAYMVTAYGQSEALIAAELGDLLFIDPVEGYVPSDQYLSGDVKTKLLEAKKAAHTQPALNRNVAALEKAIPADKLPSEIHASLGAAWIPADIFAGFAKEISGAETTYSYIAATAQWLAHGQTQPDLAKNSNEYGTLKMGALDILTLTMNSRAPEIKKKVSSGGEERSVTDEEATEAVRSKADKIRSHWDSWLWADGSRADILTSIYNAKFNRVVERRYDGSHMTFPGMSPAITLLAHQKNGAWRGLQDRNMLMDQVVGAGKTYEGVAMIMEMRRLGIAKKPMFAVPNHLTLQWRSEFYKLYPGANVLAATPQDFDKENRERFFSKIVTGNWDAVIVGHSSLKKIAVPFEAEMKIVTEQLDDISDAIQKLKNAKGDRNVVRDMEKIKSNLEAKVTRLREKGGKKDDVVDFGDLGVDALFVDEMHEFKNLFLPRR